LEGIGMEKVGAKSGEEKNGDKGRNIAIKILLKNFFFFKILNVEHYHKIRHMKFRIYRYIKYAWLLFPLQ
jgi:hypothetical protein